MPLTKRSTRFYIATWKGLWSRDQGAGSRRGRAKNKGPRARSKVQKAEIRRQRSAASGQKPSLIGRSVSGSASSQRSILFATRCSLKNWRGRLNGSLRREFRRFL